MIEFTISQKLEIQAIISVGGAYTGNNGQPKLDCAGFVGLVLDIAGITNGTEGRDYNNLKGLNLIGKCDSGVRNIVESGLFKEVKNGQVKIGDIAVYNNYSHIIIVSGVQSGNANQFIHSSSYNYNKIIKGKYVKDLIGVQNSIIDIGSYKNLRYYRIK
ncbi:MAG TPA: hypothetical protein PLH80_06335 [Spirochaetota bacterium]|nr:hypothetical protein [Spirochaetota bacterium]HQG42728.1 hypothetical protein [Spirochaetota bacterium]HQI38160.1 hypothetical protein [Spirochaetota bacterium]